LTKSSKTRTFDLSKGTKREVLTSLFFALRIAVASFFFTYELIIKKKDITDSLTTRAVVLATVETPK